MKNGRVLSWMATEDGRRDARDGVRVHGMVDAQQIVPRPPELVEFVGNRSVIEIRATHARPSDD